MRIQLIQPSSTHALRHSVLRPHQTLAECIYPFDDDPSTFHMGAFEGDDLVCIASFYHEPTPTLPANLPYRLRGMATHTAHRGNGLASAVLQKAVIHLGEMQGDMLWCNARVVALGFYERLGWRITGEEFDIPTIGPHYIMFKKL